VLDFSSLDHLTLNNGQYRYVVDLIVGLATVPQHWAEFIVFGSKPQPVTEIAGVFDRPRWTYRQVKPWRFKGGGYLHQLRAAAVLIAMRVDVFHTLHSFVPIFAPCRLVYTQHDIMEELFEEYRPAMLSHAYRIRKWAVQNRVHQIIAISQCTANDTNRLWSIPKDRISLVYHGGKFAEMGLEPDTGKTAQPAQNHDGPTLLSVLNLEPRKNLAGLLRALPLILRQFPNTLLVLFGRAAWTPEREVQFNALVRELGIEKNVLCTGFVTDDTLATLYRQTTVFVFPSFYEGFGLPILEAMAVGACVVARNASSMAEIVGKAGVLVEPCDPDQMAKGILQLLENDTLRRDLSQAARRRAQEFTIERMASQTLEVYQKGLGLLAGTGK
jgi:glycosyltransferase involved in cell wall biosynthesis